jgi:hypothetical protein
LEGKWDFFKAVLKAHSEFKSSRSSMKLKRSAEIQACEGVELSLDAKAGQYKGSIIVDYFLRQRKRWSDLPPSLFR